MAQPCSITGVGITPFSKGSGATVAELAERAALEAIADSGLDPADIGVVIFGNATQGAMEGQHGIRGQLALANLSLGIIPVINVENACCSATTALQVATAYLGAGMVEHALVVGSEVMTQASVKP